MKMIRVYSLILLCTAFVLSCNSSRNENQLVERSPIPTDTIIENKPREPSQNAKLLATSRVFKRGFRDKDFGFLLESKKGTNSTVQVQSTGIKEGFNKEFVIPGQLIDAGFIDLNKDSYKELYLIIDPTDSSKNLEIISFATEEMNKVLSPEVQYPSTKEPIQEETVYIMEGQLLHAITTENNQTLFNYEWLNEEHGYILKANEINPISN